MNYFKKRKNVKILDKPDQYDRQVFLPGIIAERVVVSPELPDTILVKMNEMKVIRQNKFIHVQSFYHLMCYWSREAFLERKSEFEDGILKELRKHKSKELFTRWEIKMIAKKISSVRFDITDMMEKEMYYILSTLERMRMYKDKTPYEFIGISCTLHLILFGKNEFVVVVLKILPSMNLVVLKVFVLVPTM